MIEQEILKDLKAYLDREHPTQRSVLTVGDYNPEEKTEFRPFYINRLDGDHNSKRCAASLP